MYCINCGQEIDNDAKFCKHCGKATKEDSVNDLQSNLNNPQNTQSSIQTAPYNLMSILGIIVSGISLFINFMGLVGIAGIILSVIGLIQIQDKQENGKGLATCGIIIGAFSVIFAFISILELTYL